jgi:hypothetical protein
MTVHHLAFCAEPMRGSTVRRAILPTTSARSRGARDVYGAPDAPATWGAAIPEGVAGVGTDGLHIRPAAGHVPNGDGRRVR